MNRDFDFRVWHLPTGQMVYDININNDFVARNWNHDLTDEQIKSYILSCAVRIA